MAGPLPIGFLDGTMAPLGTLRISPLDRGFLYADAVYEVIPVYGGRPFLLAEHLARLDRSLGELSIPLPHTPQQWLALLLDLIAANGGGDMYVYLQVSRGAEWGRNHAIPTGLVPTVFAFAAELPAEEAAGEARGVRAVTAPDCRWARCDIKSTNLLGNVLAKTTAAAAGATETIFLADGELREGSSSAILVVKGDTVRAPVETNAILPSTSRRLALKLATEAGLRVDVGPVATTDLRSADEVWMCNATRALLAVVTVDDQPVGDGRPGRHWRTLKGRLDAFRRAVASRPPLDPLD
jgi:D-alanine transaminase